MIAVTGGAGFIGANLIKALNRRGVTDLVVVEDDVEEARSRDTLLGVEFRELVDRRRFLDRFFRTPIELVLHQGACTDTLESDRALMMESNYLYSRALLDACLRRGTRLLYASSAAVYGDGSAGFREDTRLPPPLNLYAESKLLFDREVGARLEGADTQVVGLRYFNVYGPGESHKTRMASPVYQFYRQIQRSGSLRLFEGSDRFERDFVWIEDVVATVCYFIDHPEISGIFNVGSGRAESFARVAELVVEALPGASIMTVPFPEALRGRYQTHTMADLTRLRASGFSPPGTPLEVGVERYLDHLHRSGSPSSLPPGRYTGLGGDSSPS